MRLKAFKNTSDIKRKMKVLKSGIKTWQNEYASTPRQGLAIKDRMGSKTLVPGWETAQAGLVGVMEEGMGAL
jgi:hypothetical protein